MWDSIIRKLHTRRWRNNDASFLRHAVFIIPDSPGPYISTTWIRIFIRVYVRRRICFIDHGVDVIPLLGSHFGKMILGVCFIGF